jgi:hypothetical protein
MAVVDQSVTTNTSHVVARLRNTTDSADIGGESWHSVHGAVSGGVGNRIHVSGFQEVVFTGAAKTFEIQYRINGTGTAGIAQARIEIWRVS